MRARKASSDAAASAVNPAARSTGLLQELAELREELLETRVATVRSPRL
jgi:hypothetical protein